MESGSKSNYGIQVFIFREIEFNLSIIQAGQERYNSITLAFGLKNFQILSFFL